MRLWLEHNPTHTFMQVVSPESRFTSGPGREFTLAPLSRYRRLRPEDVDPVSWLPRRSTHYMDGPLFRGIPQNHELSIISYYTHAYFEEYVNSMFEVMSDPYSPTVRTKGIELCLDFGDTSHVYRANRPATLGDKNLTKTTIKVVEGTQLRVYARHHVLAYAEDYEPITCRIRTVDAATRAAEGFFNSNYRIIRPVYRDVAASLLSASGVDVGTGFDIIQRISKHLANDHDRARLRLYFNRGHPLETTLRSLERVLADLNSTEIYYYMALRLNNASHDDSTEATVRRAKKLARGARSSLAATGHSRISIAKTLASVPLDAPTVSICPTGIQDPDAFYVGPPPLTPVDRRINPRLPVPFYENLIGMRLRDATTWKFVGLVLDMRGSIATVLHTQTHPTAPTVYLIDVDEDIVVPEFLEHP